MTNSDMQVVILAAGLGSRLGEATNGRPKCLLEVGGRPLIRHHQAILADLGIKNILTIVGHRADQVVAEVRDSVTTRLNDHYLTTNSLYSLWLARTWIKGSVMVINADVLADPQIYRRLLETDGNALAFDSGTGTQSEEMKVQFNADRLQSINKTMNSDHSHGENLGILKFDPHGAKLLMDAAGQIVAEGRLNEWAPAAVDAIAQEIPIRGIDIAGLPWTEIDFPEDLEHARNHVWPKIRRRNFVGKDTQPSANDPSFFTAPANLFSPQ